MNRPTKRTYVIAGEYQHLLDFAEANEIPLPRVLFVNRPERLYGLPVGFRVFVVGPPEEIDPELLAMAKQRRLAVIHCGRHAKIENLEKAP